MRSMLRFCLKILGGSNGPEPCPSAVFKSCPSPLVFGLTGRRLAGASATTYLGNLRENDKP